jgi:hypothetical protein
VHRSPVLRILLAAFLAFCTPAMCCCTLKAFVAGTDECGQRSCCVMGVSDRTENADQLGSCCEQRESESDSHDDSLPCKCHEKSIELTRLDTGGKIAVPTIQVELGLMVFIVPNPMIVMEAGQGWVVRGPVIRHHPPPNTLLAQRCLLLI